MEAIAYRLARICFQLEDVLARSPRVLASGGALHASPVWAQILADVLERPVSLPVEPEATARGAALVAQEQMGWIRSLEAAAPVADAARFEPDAERHARYRAARERQRRLEATLGTWLTSSSPPGLGGRDF